VTIGVCRVELRMPGNQSLKDKRQVVRSVLERVRNRFNVSAAEIGENDQWQVAMLGFSCVSNDRRMVDEVLGKIVAYIEASRPDAEIIDYSTEVVDAL
jgi:uncharacterized protein YlxP (DUF503 family)